MRLPIFFTAFFLGLYSGSPDSVAHPTVSISGCLLVLGICYLVSRRSFNVLTIVFILLFTLFGYLWMSALPSWPGPLQVANPEKCILVGKAASDPIDTRSGRLLPVTVDLVGENNSGDTVVKWQREHGTVMVKVGRNFHTTPGSMFVIRGKLDTRMSSLRAPLVLRYRPRALVLPPDDKPDLELIGLPGAGSSASNRLKYHLISHLAWGISNPEDELVAGITFGRKGRHFGGSWAKDFYNSGLSHLIVASGAQVSILFLPLFFLLGRSRLTGITRWILLAVLGVALTGFARLLGGEPSILRAAVMGCVLLVAIGLERKTSGFAALSAAGFFWLIVNPMLVHDASFLLSFAASFGIIYLSPVFFEIFPDRDRFRRTETYEWFSFGGLIASTVSLFRKLRRFLLDIALITFAAQIGVFPALACTVGRISLSGLIANLAAVPIAQVILYLGALSSVGGYISPVIPITLNGILEVLANSLMVVAGFFSRVPYASVPVEPLPGWFAFLWYAVMFLSIESRNIFQKGSKKNRPVKAGRIKFRK